MAAKGVVIVTGASQGIGAGLVHAFVDRGYNVVATARSMSRSGFKASPSLALVDGDIGQESTAENVVGTALAKFWNSGFPKSQTKLIAWAIAVGGCCWVKPAQDCAAQCVRRFLRKYI